LRGFLRKFINGILGGVGYEIRRKHNSDGFLEPVQFRTIVDGGANVGEYSAAMRAKYPAAEIYVFEPTPKLFRGLQRLFANDPRTTCYAQALGERKGTAVFHLTPDTVSSSLLEQTDSAADGTSEAVEVEVATLDDWAENRVIARPARLKLDIEGNELAALHGAEKLLKNIDFVELETTFRNVRRGQPTLREIVNFMHEHEFDLVDIYPGIMDVKTGRSDWADILFANRTTSANDDGTP
jgi:FkbM family methyltransferase